MRSGTGATHGLLAGAPLHVEEGQRHGGFGCQGGWMAYEQAEELMAAGAAGTLEGVKIWVRHEEQSVSSKFSSACFLPIKELTPITFNPISTISLVALGIQLSDLVLATGRGLGALESWTCHISNGGFESAGSFHAHDKVITGLEWAFGGRCLYSRSQVN